MISEIQSSTQGHQQLPLDPLGVLEENRLQWQKVGMRAEGIAWIEDVSNALEREPISLEFVRGVMLARKVGKGLNYRMIRGRIWSVEFPPASGRRQVYKVESEPKRNEIGVLRIHMWFD
jgi:hypothetical protein